MGTMLAAAPTGGHPGRAPTGRLTTVRGRAPSTAGVGAHFIPGQRPKGDVGPDTSHYDFHENPGSFVRVIIIVPSNAYDLQAAQRIPDPARSKPATHGTARPRP